jgi:hypothetical protein
MKGRAYIEVLENRVLRRIFEPKEGESNMKLEKVAK